MLYPNGEQLAYSYDAAHRLVSVTDSLGNRIDYTLDALGNPAPHRSELQMKLGALGHMGLGDAGEGEGNPDPLAPRR